MRTLVTLGLVVAALASLGGAAEAQELDTRMPEVRATARPSGERWAFAAGDTVGDGKHLIGAELGWPDVTLGWLYGVGPRTDVGLKLELAYGVEGTTETKFGFGLRVPLRYAVLRRDKVGILVHADPGIKLYTSSPLFFGFQLPFGLTASFSPTRAVSVGMGVDVQLLIGVAGPNTPGLGIGPLFGPEIEYRIDDELVIGLNTRFGPQIAIGSDDYSIGVAGGTLTKFAFRVQLLLGYRM